MTRDVLLYTGAGIILVVGAYYVFFSERVVPQQQRQPSPPENRPSISDRNVLVTRRVLRPEYGGVVTTEERSYFERFFWRDA